ncbi:hypothetical protein Aple_068180 [Acrocarpospora pleiomorpha]|uniref:Band 7 domain-containing protein n=2 Tax=Acrocarpospora pleiomorpha TaxID=90975 RepID=A0A5M3XV57_9ACTN|nr:hypothetical protein Aple_068180 [Acrocarpospora pleiomorpha]
MSMTRQERTGWTSVIRSWFRSTPILESSSTHVIDPPFTFETPAFNDSFHFPVSVRLQWRATGNCPEGTLSSEVNLCRERFRYFVEDTIRFYARGFEPHRAADAEATVNEKLKGVRVVDHGVQLECTAVIRLLPPLPVVQQQQQFLHQRLEREAGHEATKRQIEVMTDLRRRWREFLSEGLDDWITPHAVRLAETSTGIANVTDTMLGERRDEAEAFLGMVQRVVEAQRAANVFDFVTSSETVMRNTLKMMGLPVPDLVPGSVFGDPDDAR